MKIFHRSVFPEAVTSEFNALADEFEQLRSEEAARIARMKDYREENELSREADIFGQVADLQDYGRTRTNAEPSRHNIPVPLGLALTIKHGFRIFGRLPDAIVDRREETYAERYRSDTIEKLVWAIIRASGGDTLFKDAAWDGSQLGSSCFDIYWDEKKQLPKIRPIDPTGVLVVPGVDDPHDFARVYRFWEVSKRSLMAQYGEAKFRDVEIPIDSALSQDRCVLVQVSDKKDTKRFVVEGFDAESDIDALPLEEYKHGLDFVPYVVIPNIGPEREVWGWADYELVRGLVHYIPALLSREADLMRASAGGAYLEKGTGQSPAKILGILRKGGLIPSKRDGEVTPVDTPDVPDFSESHADRSTQLMKMVGFAPDAAWGEGGTTSGSDRNLQLQPLLELTGMKQTNWSSGLERIFYRALRMMELKQTFRTKYSGSVQKGPRRVPFILPELGPTLEDGQVQVGEDNEGAPIMEKLPRTLEGLFDGDYCVRFIWQNRIDPEDPAFVNNELAKFQQGAQSLRTTLEHLGVQNPEDEMTLIEQEADRFPWLRQGSIALIEAQLRAEAQAGPGQGAGGGNPGDPTAGLFEATGDFAGTDTAASDADFAAKALPGQDGPLYGRQ